MKSVIFTLLILLVSLQSFAQFDGYIVKFRNRNLTDKVRDQYLKNKIGRSSFYRFDSIPKSINSDYIEYSEPNYYFSNQTYLDSLTDPAIKKQWAINNQKWSGVDLNLKEAWEITTGSPNVIIAIIDSGVEYWHTELRPNILINEIERNGMNGVDDDHNGYVDDVYGYNISQDYSNPYDRSGHGTHIAGIIGARHNGEGVVGVMNDVRILPIRFSEYFGGTVAQAIEAIEYAVSRGAMILNCSWGGEHYSESLKEVIAEVGKKGVVLVAASGNSFSNNDETPMYPASYLLDNVISVGSMAPNGQKSKFSNYGKKRVHVFAPGSDIYSTYRYGKYISKSGTSMATPFVSGVVGLLKSLYPELTPIEVRQRLIHGTRENQYLKDLSVSGGQLDAYKVLIQ